MSLYFDDNWFLCKKTDDEIIKYELNDDWFFDVIEKQKIEK